MSNILIACDSNRNVVRLIGEHISSNNTTLTNEELSNWIYDTYIRRTKNHMFLVNTCAQYLKPFFDHKFGERSGVFEKFILQCQKHDLDKFHGNEKVAYYALRTIKYNSEWSCLYESDDKSKLEFLSTYWPSHYNENPHHPEYWGKVIEDENSIDCNSYTRCTRDDFEAKFKTPEEQAIVIAEMVADWMAMGVELGDSANSWDNKTNGKRFVWDDDIRDLYLDPMLSLEPKKIFVDLPYPKESFSIPELKTETSTEGIFDSAPVKLVNEIYYEIKNFPVDAFFKKLHKTYKTSKLEHLIQIIGIGWWASSRRTIKIHRFFIPELIYLLEKFQYSKSLIDTIKLNTWISDNSTRSTKINIDRIAKNMNCKLYPHQIDFINSYPINKDTRKLRGYLLSFEQGLGKTITSLALMEALGKEKVVIICPKNTMQETWEKHIKTFYNSIQSMHLAGFRNTPGPYRFFILNYDRIGELNNEFYQKQFGDKSVGVIIDESHNFLRQQSLRTQALIQLAKSGVASDVLLLSGTPLKCQGVEMLPLIKVLDPFFDEAAETIFKKAFGINTEIAADVLNCRLHAMMTRVTKEVLDLPEKKEWVVKIQMPTGYKYTMKSVKIAIADYINERKEFHKKQMSVYYKEFNECIEFLKRKLGKDHDFLTYIDIIERLIKTGGQYEWGDTSITWANKYEKEVLEPLLPPDLLKKFRHSKAAVKYLHLKIRGEVLGNCLMHLRMQMTSEMLIAGDIQKYVSEAIKKTVIFSSYVDTIESCEKYFKSNSYKPLCIYGKTSDNLAALVGEFQNNPDTNPLIASIQTLSTGATLTAANRLIFLNKPWRSIEYQQASDRIHRIGQDTPVDIISLVLDTGKEDNLSTRMEEVMAWSNSLFSAIVDGASSENIEYPEDAEYGYDFDISNENDNLNDMNTFSTEAMSTESNKKRQQIVDYICKVYDTIDPSKTNSTKFKGLVEKMTDREFDNFMNLIKEGKYQLHIIAPNLKINLRNENILKAADTVGCKLFHRFWIEDHSTGRKFLTDNEYLVIQVPIRRQQQFLDEKIAVPDHDRTIDGMTGQVTGDSRNCSVTNPEIQILAARGLNNTLEEFVNVRGGNINNYNDFRRALEETGECNLTDLDPNSKTRVAVVGGVLLKSMMLDTNL